MSLSIFDYISGFIEELTTRRGREAELGIPANKRDRALRERAVEEFKTMNPNFYIRGNTEDYDGYVQYIRDGEKYCEFIEGERNCLRAVDRYIAQIGYDSVHRELTSSLIIPKIRDLFADYDQYFSKKLLEDKYLINVVMAKIWLDHLFNNPTKEKDNKRMIYENFLEFIKNKEIPFYNICDIDRSGPYSELLVVSKIMIEKNINLGFVEVALTPVNHQSFQSVVYANENDIYLKNAKIRWWCAFFERRQGIVVTCGSLNVIGWR